MTDADSTNLTDVVRLATMADWMSWYNIIKGEADREGIWEYCDPAASPPAKLERPAAVTPSIIYLDRKDIKDLKATKEIPMYRLLKDDYLKKLRLYKRQLRAINTLARRIDTTVSKPNFYLIRNQYTIPQKLKVLKQYLEPNKRAKKREA